MQDINHFRLPFLAIGVALSVSACGSGSDTTTPDATDFTDPALSVRNEDTGEINQPLIATPDVEPVDINFNGASELSGTWVQCGGGIQNTYVFDGSNFEFNFALYEYDNCQGDVISSGPPPSQPLFSGTYVLSGITTTFSGLTAMNIDFTTTYWYSEIDSVDNLLTLYEEDLVIISHDIVYAGTIDELVFGRGSSAFPEQRPTALKFEAPFIRRQ